MLSPLNMLQMAYDDGNDGLLNWLKLFVLQCMGVPYVLCFSVLYLRCLVTS